MWRWLVYSGICVLQPLTVHGAVLINEVAWMGTHESYLCEWIELHNDGVDVVDIQDWKLQIDDTVTAVADGEGSYTIPVDGHLLIKRVTNSCPDPVPSVSGLQLAFGDVSNSGATLALLRSDDSLEDQVAGGEEWGNIGGDNETKATPQRTSSGWVTAEATPGRHNQTSASSGSRTSASATSTADTSGADEGTDEAYPRTDSDANQLVQATDDVRLRLDIPRVGYVHKPIEFAVEPLGSNQTVRNSLRYTWNFGDTYSVSQKTGSHTYVRPGTYIITLHATFATREVVARHEITILPITAEITRADTGDIQLHNNAPYDLDISQYRLTGDKTIFFPDYSLLPPHETLTIPRRRIESGAAGYVALYNTKGDMVASNAAEIFPSGESDAAASGGEVVSAVATATQPRPQVAGASTAATTSPAPAVVETDSTTNTAPVPWYYRYWEHMALGILIAIAIWLIAPPRYSTNRFFSNTTTE